MRKSRGAQKLSRDDVAAYHSENPFWFLSDGSLLPAQGFDRENHSLHFGGYIQVTMILVAVRYLFDVPIQGDVLLLLIAFLFIAANLSMGITFSMIVKNQLQALADLRRFRNAYPAMPKRRTIEVAIWLGSGAIDGPA